MNLKQNIPNLLTLANLACGVLAIIYIMEEPSNKESFKDDCPVNYINYIHVGAFFILIASVFDFFTPCILASLSLGSSTISRSNQILSTSTLFT